MVFTSLKYRVTRHGCGWQVRAACWSSSMEPSAVNHLWQFLQQVILSDGRVHVFILQMVVSEFIDQLLKVVHSRGGGSSVGGGDGAGRSYACSPWLWLSGSLQHWAEIYRESCYLCRVWQCLVHVRCEKHQNNFNRFSLGQSQNYLVCVEKSVKVILSNDIFEVFF